MAVFLSTYENKLDKKGRISVPAPFRAALGVQSFNGIVLFRSHKYPALDGCGMDRMEILSQSLDELDMFSDNQDDLGAAIFADATPLPFDADGRITLTQPLIDHINITSSVLFVGAGPLFRLWEPTRFAAFQDEARQKIKSQGLTLKLNRSKKDD